jgi:hypothetical protein
LWSLAAGGLRAGGRVDYARAIKPILTARCYACHGALQQKAGLRLDTVALMRKGGDNGPVIAGPAADSPLLLRVQGARGGRMPPASEGEGLKPNEIALIRSWLAQGATGPAGEQPEADPRDHWAFKPPVRPVVPALRGWGRNPIDAFVAAEHHKRGLKPRPPADRRLLLRRLYLDLAGLPPTRAEQAAFLTDAAPGAYERAVERLLASKGYGERWGRHWMDVWRYSDWWGLGAEVRNSQKHIWHWRDWIIESLNDDKGYDQILREMLAADELYPTDPNRLRATGYLARHYFKFNRNTWLEEAVEHTAKAFLGLTMNCARCHDHKYDPIAQQDFYRFRAFFEPYQLRTDMVPGEADVEKAGIPRAFDCNLDVPTYLFVRGDEKHPRTNRPIRPGLPAILQREPLDIRPVSLPPEAHTPGLLPLVLENQLRVAQRQIAAAQAALTAVDTKYKGAKRREVAAAEKALAAAMLEPEVLKARAAADRSRLTRRTSGPVVPPGSGQAGRLSYAAHAALLERQLAVLRAEAAALAADSKKAAAANAALAQARKALAAPGETYTPLRGSLKTLESNVETQASRDRPFPTTSTGRRSALARWMTDARNPLTARVAVNHVWARHFGRPLVATVFDFGRKGARPTHPELLDWLAVEFIESGWSMKHLHRLIVTSETYRLSSSSAGAEANRTADPENRYLWRRHPVRMESQVIRDSLLYLSGELDERVGGPPVPVGAPTNRRSLYFVHSHNDQQKFLSMFDDASVLECYRRAESIIPQQALTLQNSRLALATAEKIAAQLDATTTDEDFVRAAFEAVLGCSPSPEEREACMEALKELHALAVREKKADPRRRARTTLVHALLNHNDFVTVR